jgi:DNA-binding transcriptional regulator YiaG
MLIEDVVSSSDQYSYKFDGFNRWGQNIIRRPENLPMHVKGIRRQPRLSREAPVSSLGVSFAPQHCWENGITMPSKLAQQQLEHLCAQKKQQGESAE